MLKRLADDLRALQAADQLRDLTIPAGMQLGSNDYLGLSTHPKIKEAIRGALDEDDRVCSTGSRLLAGNHNKACAAPGAFGPEQLLCCRISNRSSRCIPQVPRREQKNKPRHEVHAGPNFLGKYRHSGAGKLSAKSRAQLSGDNLTV